MNENTMPEMDDDLRPEYDLSTLKGGVRGRYAELPPTIEATLQQPIAPADGDETWESLAEQLINTSTSAISAETPALSKDATRREGIYDQHP